MESSHPAYLSGAAHVAAEQAIRDMAAVLINSCHMRRDHPTYGYTKRKIVGDYERLEGAVEMYGILAGQIGQPGLASFVTFLDATTTERVTTARRLYQQT
jgi:hypothetical protein